MRHRLRRKLLKPLSDMEKSLPKSRSPLCGNLEKRTSPPSKPSIKIHHATTASTSHQKTSQKRRSSSTHISKTTSSHRKSSHNSTPARSEPETFRQRQPPSMPNSTMYKNAQVLYLAFGGQPGISPPTYTLDCPEADAANLAAKRQI